MPSFEAKKEALLALANTGKPLTEISIAQAMEVFTTSAQMGHRFQPLSERPTENTITPPARHFFFTVSEEGAISVFSPAGSEKFCQALTEALGWLFRAFHDENKGANDENG